MRANTAGPSSAAISNGIVRLVKGADHRRVTASCHAVQAANTGSSATTFGRMSTAIESARPAPAAVILDSPRTRKIADAQAAPVGRSAIGLVTMNSVLGLVATRNAA